MSIWEIAIYHPNAGQRPIPFALCYNDVDRTPGTPNRMGNVALEPDPKKQRDVIYADDLGELIPEVKEHK
jgi:hypothetical protein